ncbi:MAG: antitoxin [Betaproteobacteria bacterium RIFCSPLOWO2_12_FULL_62_58]|jgi:prevent-host-death family protein|nr:MAG: antitoxin [Betaproteobacteria bacterium RIFCSPLOWO2_12_FULL_62_58]
MGTVNIHEAKTHLSRLVEEVAEGAEIVIAKNGVPRARLVPLGSTRRLKFGVLKGKIRYPDDFDAPLPDEVLAQFEGRRK